MYLSDTSSAVDRLQQFVLRRLDQAIAGSTPEADISDEMPESDQLALIRSHPKHFRRHLVIDVAGEKRKLESTLDEWQRADFEATDAAWMQAARVSSIKPSKDRAYLERPRGHSKTSDTALMACWAVLASPMMIKGYAAAAAEEQAGLILIAASTLISENPWLERLIKVQGSKIVNKETKSFCRVVPAKANTNFGHTPDFVICDELTHWTDKKVWGALFSGLAKVPTCTMIVISNAGIGKGSSWQWKLREKFRVHPRWYFHSLNGIEASWMTSEDIDEQKSILDADDFRRLMLNVWITGTANGIPHDHIVNCTTLANAAVKRDHGCDFIIGGLDYGLKRHRSSLVWLGGDDKTQTLKLLGHRTWKPSKGKMVQIADVEDAISKDVAEFGYVDRLFADEYQAVSTIQRINANPEIRMTAEGVSFASSLIVKSLAKEFVESFREERLQLYYDETLEQDILAVEVVTNPVSRTSVLKAEEDERGHADSAFALALANLMGVQFLKEGNPQNRQTSTQIKEIHLD